MKPNNPRYLYTNINKENKSSRPYTSQSLKKAYPQLLDSKEKLPSINKRNGENHLEKTYKYSKKFSVQHPYWEREQLLDRCIKLQTQLNNLNAQYRMTKIENHHQKETINKQNKILNEYNNKQFENKKDKKEDEKYDDTQNYQTFKTENQNYQTFKSGDQNYQTFKSESQNYQTFNQNYQSYKSDNQGNEINDEYNFDSDNEKTNQNKKLRTTRKKIINSLTEEERKQIAKEENEKEQIEKDEKMKLLSEALISNLKMRCKQLVKENQEKDEEIKKLKRDMKSSKVSELERERDIYAEEMIIIKQKLEDALDKINNYEKREIEFTKLKTQKNKQF